MAESADPSPSLSMKMAMKGIRMRWSRVNQMDTASLEKLLADPSHSVMLLDTRPQEEFSVSHIDNARCVNPEADDVSETLKDVLQKAENGPVTAVCYCSVGYRSALYANTLMTEVEKIQDDKIRNQITIHNLEGSLFKWANEGRAMVDKNNQPTVFAHPYNAVWGKLLMHELRKTLTDS